MDEFMEVFTDVLKDLDEKCSQKIAQRKQKQKEKKLEPESNENWGSHKEYTDRYYNYVWGGSFTEALTTLIEDYEAYGEDSTILGIRQYKSNNFYTICHTDTAPQHFYLVEGQYDLSTGEVDDSSIRPYTITNNDLFSDVAWEIIFRKSEEDFED